MTLCIKICEPLYFIIRENHTIPQVHGNFRVNFTASSPVSRQIYYALADGE